MAATAPIRIRSASTTVGTGAYAFSGSPFSPTVATGDMPKYHATDRATLAWGRGIGTIQADGSLTRTTVTANSSGTTAALSWVPGTRDVAVTPSGPVGATPGSPPATALLDTAKAYTDNAVANNSPVKSVAGLAGIIPAANLAAALVAPLPTTLPATPGVMWNNGGTSSVS